MSQQPISMPPDAEEEKRRRLRHRRAMWIGIGMANLSGLVLILMNQYLITGPGKQGFYIASDFTLVPLVMGIVAEFYWRTTKPTSIQRFGLSALTVAIALCLAAIFLLEGIICLVMAAPLLIVIVWLGAIVGSRLFSKADNRLRVNIIPLLLVLMVCDAKSPHHYSNAVTDTITIRATPAQVWPYIAEYPRITQPPDYWLWRIGLPCPIQSTATGGFIGAERKCIFTRNAIFTEHITVCRPQHELAFDVIGQPHDPEIVNHVTLERGQFLLQGNADGTTTLTGTSWYRLNIYPAAYFNLWTEDIIRHVHLRVMTQIRSYAEKQVKQ